MQDTNESDIKNTQQNEEAFFNNSLEVRNTTTVQMTTASLIFDGYNNDNLLNIP